MAFKPQSEEESALSEINVTPLVDVMLVLVIILLVTAPLLTQSVHVSLPKTTQTTTDVKDQPLQLGIDAQGVITVNKIPMADLPTLEYALKSEIEKKKLCNFVCLPSFHFIFFLFRGQNSYQHWCQTPLYQIL